MFFFCFQSVRFATTFNTISENKINEYNLEIYKIKKKNIT